MLLDVTEFIKTFNHTITVPITDTTTVYIPLEQTFIETPMSTVSKIAPITNECIEEDVYVLMYDLLKKLLPYSSNMSDMNDVVKCNIHSMTMCSYNPHIALIRYEFITL